MLHNDIFLARQPILDRQQNIQAYELLFRDSHINHAQIDNELHATASVIVSLFNEMGLQSVLGKERGFINVDACMLMSDMVEMLPPERMVLELLETVEVTPLLLERCRQLKRHGFALALDDFAAFRQQYRDLLPLVDVIKVDLTKVHEGALRQLTQRLKKYPARLLAEKVETPAQFEQCKNLGYHYFQGYYFARPTLLSGRRAEPSTLALFRLLSLVLDDAATDELEKAIKADSNLTYNLVRLVNSVGAGFQQRIHSLAQAVMVIGRRQLQRWLQLLLYTVKDKGQISTPLMQMAATRAKMLEIMMRALHNHDTAMQDCAFITGTFSLLDTLLSMPMTDIVTELHLHDDVKAALTQRTGILGAMLLLIEDLEKGDFATAEKHLAQLPGLDLATLNEAHMAAIRWVNGLNDVH